MSEKTQAQILIQPGWDGLLPKTEEWNWPHKVRDMRRDPTIGLARALIKAPILAADWTVVTDMDSQKNDEDQNDQTAEADDPILKEAVDLVERIFVKKLRKPFLNHAAAGMIDFGWAPFEKVFCIKRQADGYLWVILDELKPLLQDLTEILVEKTGERSGVRNTTVSHEYIDLDCTESIVISHDPEAQNWYGEPLMRRAEPAYDGWLAADKSARRYDEKVAGAHWIVYYPPGKSTVNGQEKDNAQIAKEILNAMKANGAIAIPATVSKQVDDLNDLDTTKLAWRVELMTATGATSDFDTRLRYYDVLKARALNLPERAILEGQFGTKAEAEAHADFAIDSIEEMHVSIVDQLNAQCVDQVMMISFGPDYVGRVQLKPQPLSDDKKEYLKDLYTAYFSSDDGRAELADKIDWDAVAEMFGIPLKDEPDVPAMGSPAHADDPTKTQASGGDPTPTSVLPASPIAT